MHALDLLSGDARTFIDRVWASLVHVHETDPADLVSLLSLDDVDHLLTSVALRTPALRVVEGGTVLPSSRFTRGGSIAGTPLTGLVDPRKVMDLYAGGATLVLQGLHRYWPPLTELVRTLELELGHPCQANAYLTPPDSQGFARHQDTHDVFVFQTHGRKVWTIVEGDVEGGVEGGVERDLELVPGLSVYLPTGTPHSARSQAEPSLHVTIGINRVTWRDLLGRLSEQALSDSRFDTPLPAGFLADPARLSGPLADELATLAKLLGELDPVAATEASSTRFLSERPPALRGALTDLVALRDLDDSTVLERRPTAACELRPDGDRLHVLLGDRELRMPLRLADAMAHVRDHPRLTVGDLAPWLDESSRIVVARRLVREGLLRIRP